ncbi:MAG: hypothetical protein ABSG43_28405 [Solirubrobacteraceae bacterium]
MIVAELSPSSLKHLLTQSACSLESSLVLQRRGEVVLDRERTEVIGAQRLRDGLEQVLLQRPRRVETSWRPKDLAEACPGLDCDRMSRAERAQASISQLPDMCLALVASSVALSALISCIVASSVSGWSAPVRARERRRFALAKEAGVKPVFSRIAY